MYAVIFDEQANSADWSGDNATWQVLGDDGVAEDIYGAGWTVTIKVARLPRGARYPSDYGAALSSPDLTGSTADGTITVNDEDALTWTFTAAQMGNLCGGAYAVQLVATKDGLTRLLLLGTLPVIEGL